MNRILVGARNGRAVINWPTVLAMGLIVGIVVGVAGAGTWYVLTREISLPTLIFPVPLAIGYFIGEALRTRWSEPLEKLTRRD